LATVNLPKCNWPNCGSNAVAEAQIVCEYIDAGVSGAKDRRPELDRLMQDAHKRKFDVVTVWKFDRFARSVSPLLRALDTFRVLRVEFVSLSESVDTATPVGRMAFTVLGGWQNLSGR
jgi:DNA invertase Pin-like site-specific DNA recombinase